MHEISVGPFLVAARQIIPIAAIVIGALVIRFFAPVSLQARKRALDVVSNGGLLFFLVWKLSPILTETGAILRDPRVLLVAPGGHVGIILGAVAVAGYLLRLWLKAGRPAITSDMVRSQPVIVLIALMGIVALVTGLALHGANLAVAGSRTDGNTAADFELENLDGQMVSLSDHRGQVVVLNFWATWCVPCRAESEVKNRIASEYDSDDVLILGINLTSGEAGRSVVEEHAREWEMQYPVLLDTYGEVASAYNVRGTPTTIVIDEEGRISRRYFGAMSLSAARRLVNSAAGPSL